MNNFIFNKLRYNNVTDEENFNIKSIGDYLFEDIDIKKMSPSRFTYYKDLLDIYNKNPKILYNVLRKYYRFDELKSKEKKLLNNINFNQESYLKADKSVKAVKEILDKHLRDIKKKERDERKKVAETEENHKVPEEKVAETTKEDENDKIKKVAEATNQAEELLRKKIVGGGGIDIYDRNESILRDELKNNLDLFNIDNLSEPIIK